MANRQKNWTREEMEVLRSAVNANPTNPHAEFSSVAQIVKKSKAAVNAKYGRMYGSNRVLAKKRPVYHPDPAEVSTEHAAAKTENSELSKAPKKRLNAFQRFIKKLFNI
jgi:hypothetical protein